MQAQGNTLELFSRNLRCDKIPVKAKMVEIAGAYIWSSYNIIIGNEQEKIIENG